MNINNYGCIEYNESIILLEPIAEMLKISKKYKKNGYYLINSVSEKNIEKINQNIISLNKNKYNKEIKKYSQNVKENIFKEKTENYLNVEKIEYLERLNMIENMMEDFGLEILNNQNMLFLKEKIEKSISLLKDGYIIDKILEINIDIKGLNEILIKMNIEKSKLKEIDGKIIIKSNLYKNLNIDEKKVFLKDIMDLKEKEIKKEIEEFYLS